MKTIEKGINSSTESLERRELILQECKKLLGNLENQINNNKKLSDIERTEYLSMKDRLSLIINSIEQNHQNLPIKYKETIQSIKEKLWMNIDAIEKKNLSPEQEKAIEEIKKLKDADSAIKRASTYATVMDGYCLESLLWLVEGVWDLALGAIDTAVFLKLAGDVDASLWDKMKIVTRQTLDTVIWSVPLVGDIADFLFKSNKKSAKILERAFVKHKKELEEKYGTETVARLMKANTSRVQKVTDILANTTQIWAKAVNIADKKWLLGKAA